MSNSFVLLSKGFSVGQMLIFSWNVRGLGREEKRRKVRKVVMFNDPSVLFLQETKRNIFDANLIRSIGGNSLTRGVGVEAVGAAGGLMTLWNEDMFSVSHCVSNHWCIVLVGKLLKLDKTVVLCNVYAPNNEGDRKSLWEFLLSTQQSFDFPWCFGGDFEIGFLRR